MGVWMAADCGRRVLVGHSFPQSWKPSVATLISYRPTAWLTPPAHRKCNVPMAVPPSMQLSGAHGHCPSLLRFVGRRAAIQYRSARIRQPILAWVFEVLLSLQE